MAEQKKLMTPVRKWIATLLLLLILVTWLDVSDLMAELGRLPAWILLPALLLTVMQVCMSAWRWVFTARYLRLVLPYGVAVKEYYLATFLNQVLPGGVVGDVNRAWRHSQDAHSRLSSIHAVVIERLSGQLVLFLLAGMFLSRQWAAGELAHASVQPPEGSGLLDIGIVAGLMAVISAIVVGLFRARLTRYGHHLMRDLRSGLLGWPAFPVQVLSSLVVVGSYLALFLVLAFGAGYLQEGVSVCLLLALCSGLLVSMVIPVTVAGWGVREGTAAVLWPLAGLPAEQGVALSIGYGVIVLLSSLPGALFMFSSAATAR